MKTTVIYHSADYDGIFSREIAKKFLPPDTEFIGWDFGNPLLSWPQEGTIYVLDLPIDKVFGSQFSPLMRDKPVDPLLNRLIWIDHHKSSIESHPVAIPGYRIDGVAACRLAWQWFTRKADDGKDSFGVPYGLPNKQHFIDRVVGEPIAVRLAGEYDIWDKRDPRAETFQFGLRSRELTERDWSHMFMADGGLIVPELLENGKLLQQYQQRNDADTMDRSFRVEFEGLRFLCLNTARCNSLTFAAKDVPATGHDALMGFYWNGEGWTVSLYHARHNTSIDLSLIAVKYGGGGHRGACGFRVGNLPGISQLPFISA